MVAPVASPRPQTPAEVGRRLARAYNGERVAFADLVTELAMNPVYLVEGAVDAVDAATMQSAFDEIMAGMIRVEKLIQRLTK